MQRTLNTRILFSQKGEPAVSQNTEAMQLVEDRNAVLFRLQRRVVGGGESVNPGLFDDDASSAGWQVMRRVSRGIFEIERRACGLTRHQGIPRSIARGVWCLGKGLILVKYIGLCWNFMSMESISRSPVQQPDN
jgi:hypothetical protein